jgi:eukaryotic-like serine/threonine-protein kinase
MPFALGTHLGHYEIRSLLGAGGMGEIYLAMDTNLRRPVAVKVIHEKFCNNKEYWNRFEREARAVSALNHPNILVIHDSGRVNERSYIVTELVDGVTLRRYMEARPRDLSGVLDLVIQTASALKAAHAVGIIHRDIKPENIMVRSDGYVKVLDFGLAKMVEGDGGVSESSEHARHTDLSTVSLHTDSRSIVGTVSYMSPEQLRGAKLDGRTDIWSLGVVTYELVTAHAPFDRATESDKIVAVLEHAPPPLSLYADDVPAELQRIVSKALAKDRDERYQSAAEFLNDLTDLKQEIDYLCRKQRDGQSGAPSLSLKAGASGPVAAETAPQATAMTTEQPRHFFEGGVARALRLLMVASLFVGLLAGGFYLRNKLSSDGVGRNGDVLPEGAEFTKLTNNGQSIMVAISPDGKYIAYVHERGRAQSLVVKGVNSKSFATVVPEQEVSYRGLTFSPDGDYIYYVRAENNDVGRLYRIPLIGGSGEQIAENVNSPVAFSPDGKLYAFVRFDRSLKEYRLVVAGADGVGERDLMVRRPGEDISLRGIAWSPDGHRIVCAVGSWSGGYHVNLIEVGLADGVEKAITSKQWFSVSQIAWPQEGDLIVSGSAQSMAPVQLWSVSYPGDEVKRITDDFSDYVGVSVTRDASTIISVQSNRIKTLWVTTGTATRDEKQITTVTGASYGIAWANNQIIFSAMAGSALTLFAINPDGSNQKQLTGGTSNNYHPAATADGRYIVFSSNRTGSFNIWRMNADGSGQPIQLTDGGGDFYPHCSPDGKWVVYEHQSDGVPTLWKVSIDGGQPVRLTEQYASAPAVAPDGKFIACRYYTSQDVKGIAIIPFEGGQPVKVFNIPIINWQRVRWAANGQALIYIDSRDNVYNIWSQGLDGSPPKRLTDFRGDQIFSYEWAPDSTHLACERGMAINDVVSFKRPR